MYQWLYKDSIENGVKVLLEDVAEYKKDGWVDPADLGKEVVAEVADEEVSELEDMSKSDLEEYAKVMFSVDIDRRKSKANLIIEIAELEAN